MFLASIFCPVKQFQFLVRGEKAHKQSFYVGSTIAILSAGGSAYAAFKDSKDIAFPAFAVGLYGSAITILSIENLKILRESKKIEDEKRQLLREYIQEERKILHLKNISRSLEFLANDYKAFWELNHEYDRNYDKADYELEFASAFVYGVQLAVENRLLLLRAREEGRKGDPSSLRVFGFTRDEEEYLASECSREFQKIDLKVIQSLVKLMQAFQQKLDFGREGRSVRSLWGRLFVSLLAILQHFSIEYESIIERYRGENRQLRY